MDFKKVGKPVILLFFIIFLCAVFVRVFAGTETLGDYAQKNPEVALRPVEKVDKQDTGEMGGDILSPDANQVASGESTHTISNNNTAAAPENPPLQAAESEDSNMTAPAERIEFKTGFYYEPLSEDIKRYITGISYPAREGSKDTLPVKALNVVADDAKLAVDYEDLRYVSVLYYNLKGIEKSGELICHKSIAQDMVEIFYELHRNNYQIEQIQLIDEYSGDDTLSMKDNNTSCFNYRVVDGTDNLSKHAYGLAIDINPFFNPYVVFQSDGSTYISPPGSESYADRSKDFAYKIDENDLCLKLFKEHGFTWGGDWNSMKDYQHFQKPLD